MVKIAIAGGSSTVANEIIDALVATQRHELVVLSRKVSHTHIDIPTHKADLGITQMKTTYEDQAQLVEVLQGVHTVLSFLVTPEDPASIAQKNLIDAAIQAGVKRFAPSEWAWYASFLPAVFSPILTVFSSELDHISWYAYKGEIRRYLEELNKDKKARDD
ncbi:NAD(P)-binding protein [Penicillium manginii]|uniref:NAD(P)-binding protein n=1 Tax=Penicillium manginii TaxID=203109 RepID=UPI002548A9B7|nr:NAD(P)-binding protein [Penicillium manginii]KAJ5763788.1 NAD(P)-binding protein [Penicillium manginii]